MLLTFPLKMETIDVKKILKLWQRSKLELVESCTIQDSKLLILWIIWQLVKHILIIVFAHCILQNSHPKKLLNYKHMDQQVVKKTN